MRVVWLLFNNNDDVSCRRRPMTFCALPGVNAMTLMVASRKYATTASAIVHRIITLQHRRRYIISYLWLSRAIRPVFSCRPLVHAAAGMDFSRTCRGKKEKYNRFSCGSLRHLNTHRDVRGVFQIFGFRANTYFPPLP